MPRPRFTATEIASRARTLYESDIRAKVEPENQGKYLAVDVETGKYEVGDDYAVLVQRLRARHPDPAIHVMRVGYPAAGRIGGRAKAVSLFCTAIG